MKKKATGDTVTMMVASVSRPIGSGALLVLLVGNILSATAFTSLESNKHPVVGRSASQCLSSNPRLSFLDRLQRSLYEDSSRILQRLEMHKNEAATCCASRISFSSRTWKGRSSTSHCVLSSTSPSDTATGGGSEERRNDSTINNNSNDNNGKRQQRPFRRTTPQKARFKKGGGASRPRNPAMGDTNFLRKRTAHLLRVTADGYKDGPGGSGNGDGQILSKRGMKVDQRTFNWLIDAWAFSGELDAAEQAHALIRRMEDLQKRSESSPSSTSSSSTSQGIRPDVRSYTKVINAISRSGRIDAGEVAEKILKRMEKLYETGENMSVKPNTYTYTGVIEAYANSGAHGAAHEAARICELMETKFDEGDLDVKPTARSFNAVINAWAKSGEEGAAQRAENCLDRMEELYEAGNVDVKPNTYNFNSVINAWANSGEVGAPQRAEEILERMEHLHEAGEDDVRPTTVSFNAVIDAYAKSGEEGSARKAEELLRHMEDLYKSGQNPDAKPNVRSFNSVINVWAKSGEKGSAQKAEEVLDLMEKLYEAGNEDVKPDATSFSTVINAWARSYNFGKAERALNILRHMKDLYNAGNENVRPNVIIYNAVMNACAYTMGNLSEQTRAVEIAHAVLKDLEKSAFGKPDQVTYGTFLKVCANQMAESDTRRQIVEAVFRKCCKDGQLGNLVLQQLKTITSDEHYEKLVGRSIDEDVSVDDLPSDWTCNVVEGKWRRRRNLM